MRQREFWRVSVEQCKHWRICPTRVAGVEWTVARSHLSLPASLRKKFCKIQKKFCIVMFVLFKGNILPYNQTKFKIPKNWLSIQTAPEKPKNSWKIFSGPFWVLLHNFRSPGNSDLIPFKAKKFSLIELLSMWCQKILFTVLREVNIFVF